MLAGTRTFAYEQTGTSSYSVFGPTAQIAFELGHSSTNFVFWGNLEAMPLSLDSYPGGTQATFYSGNLRLGYAFASADSPWQFAISAGGFYKSLWLRPDNMGFGLSGMILFPILSRNLGKYDRVSFFPTFSPYATSPSDIRTDTNREWAVGLAWSHRIQGGNIIQTVAEYSTTKLTVDTGESRSSSMALTIGYGW